MNLKLAANRALLKCKKHSPEILMVAGIAGVVTASVMACKATLKVHEVLEEHEKKMDLIHATAENEEIEDYTEKDVKKDTAIQYFETAKGMIKIYGPAVLVGVTSIAAILCSNKILRKRCVALTAAYTSLDSLFKAYRERVVDKYGEEEDKKLYFGTSEVEITEVDEKGKQKKTKMEVAERSPYIKYFTKANKFWTKDDDYIQFLFSQKKKYLNVLFKEKGFLTLNEALRELGLEETSDGMIHGWIWDKENPIGDNYIQFYDHKERIPSEDGETYEDAYALEFNCDGLIYDKI